MMFIYTKPKIVKVAKGLRWEDILKIAEKYVPKAKREFLKVIAETQDSIILDELAEAIGRGDIAGAMEKIDWAKLTLFTQTFKDTFAEVIREAGEHAAKKLKKLGIEMKFDLLNPKVIDYINDHTGELIKQITDEQRKIVQDIIRRAFEEGGHPRKTAKQIKEVIGLTERQANAVNKLRQSMLEQGISVSKVEEAVSRYADRLRKYRAETIARTETLTAANKGQRLAWEQAVDKGYLDPAKYEREWVVTPDDLLCEQCAEMQGMRAPIGGVYPNGVEGPPLHPRCRCTEILVRRE